MEEQQYRLMGRSGGISMALGIVMVVFGIACGVLMIIEGAKLLVSRSKILF
ncbi:MAG: hypothetical protein IKO80_05255 [Lachnospiraceae bacterium]|nr:hypothetical protein [Lachnospiraceae bacterium]